MTYGNARKRGEKMFNEKQFKKKLIDSDLTLKEIAQAIGISETTLYRKIRGITDFSRNEMSIIKSTLNLDTDEFEQIFFA